MNWVDEYPHELYANVLLLDNKIECWKTGNTKAEEAYWPFKAHWKPNRMTTTDNHGYVQVALGDYAVASKSWTVNNVQEHRDVFEIHSKVWYRQWEHADDYKLGRAYE